MNNIFLSTTSNVGYALPMIDYGQHPAVSNTFIEDILPTLNKRYTERFIVKPVVTIFNITFTVIENENGFLLKNTQWHSLSGFGNSLHEAINNASEIIVDAIENYLYESDSNLTEDAIELKNFLFNKICN